MESLNTERGGGPGQYLWTRSRIGGADHRQEEWMKVDPGTGSGQGRNLWMISTAFLRNQMRADIEGQGIVIKGIPDQDRQKVGIKLMKERMKAKLKSQSIVILKETGPNLLNGSIVLKINQVIVKIRNQSIMIEGAQGQYH